MTDDQKIIFYLVMIPLILLIFWLSFKGKEKAKTIMQSFLTPEEKLIHSEGGGVSYLGGHPGFSAWKYGSMVITDQRIIFLYQGLKEKEAKLSIPFHDVTEVSIETVEKLTAARIILLGIFAPWWKKKEPFVLIKMKNDIGEISSLGFGFKSTSWTSQYWAENISLHRYNWFKSKGGPKAGIISASNI